MSLINDLCFFYCWLCWFNFKCYIVLYRAPRWDCRSSFEIELTIMLRVESMSLTRDFSKPEICIPNSQLWQNSFSLIFSDVIEMRFWFCNQWSSIIYSTSFRYLANPLGIASSALRYVGIERMAIRRMLYRTFKGINPPFVGIIPNPMVDR